MANGTFTIDGLRNFHDWTHASLGLMLDHLAAFGAADYDREVPDFGYSTLQRQVVHICNSEAFWIRLLMRQPYSDQEPAAFPDVPRARVLQQEVGAWTRAYLSSLTEEQLNAGMRLDFPDGDSAVHSPAFVLHHVLTHAFHHIGQIAAMCRALGRPMPEVGFNMLQ